MFIYEAAEAAALTEFLPTPGKAGLNWKNALMEFTKNL